MWFNIERTSAVSGSSYILKNDQVPKLHELQLLTSDNGPTLRIIESIASKWDYLALRLGFDLARIESIERDHEKCEDKCRDMLEKWIEGHHDLKPPSWRTLMQCLNDEFSDLVRKINQFLEQ